MQRWDGGGIGTREFSGSQRPLGFGGCWKRLLGEDQERHGGGLGVVEIRAPDSLGSHCHAGGDWC